MERMFISALHERFRLVDIIDILPDREIGIYVSLQDSKLNYVVAFTNEVELDIPQTDELQDINDEFIVKSTFVPITILSAALFSQHTQFEVPISKQRPELTIYEDSLIDHIISAIHKRKSNKIILHSS